MGETDENNSAVKDVVEFKLEKHVEPWKEPIIFILTLIAFVPWLAFVVLVGVPYFIYVAIRGKEKKKFTAPPLDKIEKTDAPREYDLVIVGVTGFTGGWAARYMSKMYGKSDQLNWAIAGRNPKKLQAVLDSMRAENPDMKEIPVIVADNMKMEDMERVAKSTRSVASFAGPFHRYGSNLVCACIKYGTNYADSTGESPWVRQMISMYHDRAVESKCRIVPMSGFDSIPSDLAVYMCSQKLQEVGDTLSSIKLGFMCRGGHGGGTLETIAALIVEPNLIMPKLGFDPMLLWDGKKNPTKITGGFKFLSKQATGQYAGLSLFADNNRQAVKRSASYHGYNEKFHYEEASVYGGMLFSIAMSLWFVMVGALYAIPISQGVLRKFLPAPGEGPDRKLCDKGWWAYNVEATGKKGEKVYMSVGAENEDPGYKSTSRMVVETAILASKIGDDAPLGIMTPACLGEALAKHLEQTGSYYRVGRKFVVATKNGGGRK